MPTANDSDTSMQWALVFISSHPVTATSIILTLFAIYRIIYQLYLYPRWLSPLRHLPGPPLGSLIVGQFGTILREEAGIPQRAWVKEHGPVVRAVGPIGIERLIFTKPEALRQILNEEWLEYPRPQFLRDVLGLVAGFGLLTVTGNEHKQMRKAMNPAFSMGALMAQMDMYRGPIDTLIHILHSKVDASPNGEIIHVCEWMSKVTLDIICLTAFGYDTDSLHNPSNPLATAYERAINLQSGPALAKFIGALSVPGVTQFLGSDFFYRTRRFWGAVFPFFYDAVIITESMHTIKGISAKILQEKIKDAAVTAADANNAKKDIMSLLVRARLREKSDGGYAMDDRAMMDQVLTFLGAGHETTASGLSWTLWLLANNKSAQDKLREEVVHLIEKNPYPDYREVKELSWLDCVINESLRVLPPVPMTGRQASKDGYIDGIFVPKGTYLYIPIRVVNTLETIWGSDAEEFKPERWYNLPKEYDSTYSVLSFIAGPHACIGKTMSIIEMKTILVHLIAAFEFDLSSPRQTVRSTAAVTMKPADDLPLRVTAVKKL